MGEEISEMLSLGAPMALGSTRLIKEAKKEKALALWQSCHTQEEIAEAVGLTRQAISTWDDDFAKSLAAKDFAKSPDFTPPIYNIWKQQDKSNAVSHFGNTEVRWLENLLYLYTDPAALVASVQDWEKAHPAHLIKEAGNVAPFLQTIVDRAAQSGASLRTQKMADQVAKANPE